MSVFRFVSWVLRFCSLWEEAPSVSVAARCVPLLQHIAGKKEAEAGKQELQEQEFFFLLRAKEFLRRSWVLQHLSRLLILRLARA